MALSYQVDGPSMAIAIGSLSLWAARCAANQADRRDPLAQAMPYHRIMPVHGGRDYQLIPEHAAAIARTAQIHIDALALHALDASAPTADTHPSRLCPLPPDSRPERLWWPGSAPSCCRYGQRSTKHGHVWHTRAGRLRRSDASCAGERRRVCV